jgi:hypothetical protein
MLRNITKTALRTKKFTIMSSPSPKFAGESRLRHFEAEQSALNRSH